MSVFGISFRCCVAALFIPLFFPGLTSGQTPSLAAAQPQLLTRQLMYRILFREVVAAQMAADRAAAESRSDAALRGYHRTKLELTPTQDSQLKQIASACVQQLMVLDNKAAAIIDGAKKLHQGAARDSADARVPPPPPELAALEEQRTALVLSAADSLATAFGPAQFAYFETLVRRHVGSSFKVVAAAPNTTAH